MKKTPRKKTAWDAGRKYMQMLSALGGMEHRSSKTLTGAERGMIKTLVDQYGADFCFAMIEELFANWALYAERYALSEPEDFLPTVGWIRGYADSLALDMCASGRIKARPRTVDVDLQTASPIERAWREYVGDAVGLRGHSYWVWTRTHERLAQQLIRKYGEGPASIYVQRVLLNWSRYQLLPMIRLGAPSLKLLVAFAEQWFQLSQQYVGPPPYRKSSDAPRLSLGACGDIETVWRRTESRFLPGSPQRWLDRAWTERDKEILDKIVERWGEELIVRAVERFFRTWPRFRARVSSSVLPDHDVFANFCSWWCQTERDRITCRDDDAISDEDFEDLESDQLLRLISSGRMVTT